MEDKLDNVVVRIFHDTGKEYVHVDNNRNNPSLVSLFSAFFIGYRRWKERENPGLITKTIIGR